MVIGVALTTIGAILAGVAALPAVIVGAIVAAVATIVVVVKDNWNAICELFSTVSEWFNGNVIQPVVGFFQGFATRVQQIFQGIWIIIQAIWIVASSWFNDNVITPISNLFNFLKTLIQTAIQVAKDFVFSTWQGVASWFNSNVISPVTNCFNIMKSGITSAFDYVWNSIKGGATGAMNYVISKIENGVNFVISGINALLKGFNNVVSVAAEVAGKDWSGVSLVPKVHIPRLASGGIFPRGEDGMAFINHNELVGKFSNGRNVVANNQQITDGIRDAVLEGMAQAMMNMNSNTGGSSAPVIENVFKCDSETLYRMTQVGKQKYNQRYIVASEF